MTVNLQRLVNEYPCKRVNRMKRSQPKTKAYDWCGCDRELLSVGQKCPSCGTRNRGLHFVHKHQDGI